MRQMRNEHKILVVNCSWEDIRIFFREIGWEGVEWIYLAQGRDQWKAFVNMVNNLRFP
jgi:hypothetical protein